VIALGTRAWWLIGSAVGVGVVLVAATLLVTIVLLARRIVRQEAEIALALDGAMRNTTPLFDLALLNHTIESLTRGLKEMSGEEGVEDERGIFQKITGALGRLR
jgi:hypothetical protein